MNVSCSNLSVLLAVAIVLTLPTMLSSQQISLPTEFRQQRFDVLSYDADIHVDTVPTREIRGVVKMVVRWTAPSTLSEPPTVFAHLLSCNIDSAFMRGLRVAPRTQKEPLLGTDTMQYYSFSAGHMVQIDDVDTLTMYYSGTMTDEGGSQPWGGVHFEDQVLYGLGVGFFSPQVSTTQHWLPCYDHPSDKAMFRGVFNVPANYDAASVGARTSDTVVAGRRIVEWTTAEPFATYLLTFSIAPYVLLKSNAGATPIEIYTLARDSASARIAFKLLPRMVQMLESRFIPYPFEKIGYCGTFRGAMEHQTMISYPVSLIQRRDTINDVALHELAHQWFGDLVSPLDFRHAWLTESFATYSECLWREELFGFPGYLTYVNGKVNDYIKSTSKSEGVFALYDFPRKAPSSNYPVTIYSKGAVVLGMLRWHLGDSAFFGGLRNYLTAHFNSTATTADMKASLELVSGKDLTSFFNEWVFGKGWAKLVVTYRRAGANWNVELQQVQHVSDTTIPVFTTLPVNVQYTDVNGVDIDTVLTSDVSGRIVLTAQKVSGINAGTKLRSLVQIEKTVNVDDADGVNPRSISLSPNPADDACTLQRSMSSAPAYISIVDSIGRTLITKVIDANTTTSTFSVAELANGSYTVRVVENGQPLSLPLVITR